MPCRNPTEIRINREFAYLSLNGKKAQGRKAKISIEDVPRVEGNSICLETKGNKPKAVIISVKQSNEKYKQFRLHRYLLNVTDPKIFVDHENWDVFDNSRPNLRVCNATQNNRNRSPQRGSSRWKGIYWHKPAKKWQGQIRYNKKKIYLGLFTSEISASLAYNSAARFLDEEYFSLNQLPEIIQDPPIKILNKLIKIKNKLRGYSMASH